MSWRVLNWTCWTCRLVTQRHCVMERAFIVKDLKDNLSSKKHPLTACLSVSLPVCLSAVCGVHREEPGVCAGSQSGQRAVQQPAGRLRQSSAVLQPTSCLTHVLLYLSWPWRSLCVFSLSDISCVKLNVSQHEAAFWCFTCEADMKRVMLKHGDICWPTRGVTFVWMINCDQTVRIQEVSII